MRVGTVRERRSLLILLVLIAVAALVVVARVDRAEPRADGALTTASVDTCADVFVLGVDGNAERPALGSELTFGPTVEAFVAPYVAQVKAYRSLTMVRLAGVMPSLATLTKGATGGRFRDLRLDAVRKWTDPIPDAVGRATSRIASQLSVCPGQQLVLVGSAQGAAVVHRTLGRLSPAARQQVAGAVLISDPLRVERTASRLTGDPTAPRWRSGLLMHIWKSSPDVPPAPAAGRNWTACTAYDLVCDPTRGPVWRAARVARSYTRSVLATVVADVVSRTRLWPTPVPRTRVLSMRQGNAVTAQLQVDIAEGRTALYAALGALPAGLTLSSSGVLSGTPTTPGTTAVHYSVRGASPATTAHYGQLSITVTPRASGPDSGGQTSCEVRSDATAWCWGRNDYGQFGTGQVGGSATPVQVSGTGFASISTSGSATCAVKVDHTLWCWGLTDYGQTGHPASTQPLLTPQRVGTSSRWSEVSVAWSHACAVRTSGELFCWGQGLRGQLGIGKKVGSLTSPQQVGSVTSWVHVETAGWHSCALRRDGSAACWGSNTMGELGIGTTSVALAPVDVAGTWASIAPSWGGTCGVRIDGSLWCWGRNLRGEVGDGTRVNRLSPVQVGAGTSWVSVSPAEQGTCALDTAGQTWCWGSNAYGQAGPDQPGVPSLTPRLVAGLSPYTSLSSGWLFFCGTDASADTHCWGNDEAQALGENGLTPPSTTPTSSGRPVSTARVITGARARMLDSLTPAQIAARGLSDRPAVTAADLAARATLGVRVMTYNVLGSQHTAPGSDAPAFAPGRVRAEWSSTFITRRNIGLVGAQEIQPNQINAFDGALGSRYAIVPGVADGYAAAPQSVLLRQPDWTVVWKSSISIPFMDGWRPQPVLRVKHPSTGRQLYFLNVHFAPGGLQKQREKAMDILVAEVRTLAKDGLPMLVTGDFNAKDWTFCQLTTRTQLVAAQGGSTGSPCSPPRPARIDWIFGSGGRFSKWQLLNSPEVGLTTDHSVQDALFSIG